MQSPSQSTVSRSATTRDQITHPQSPSRNREFIDYSYISGDHAISVRKSRASIRRSLGDAIRYMIARQQQRHAKRYAMRLLPAYEYWSSTVGLTDQDINRAYTRSR